MRASIEHRVVHLIAWGLGGRCRVVGGGAMSAREHVYDRWAVVLAGGGDLDGCVLQVVFQVALLS